MPNTEDYYMAAIDTEITEVAATLDQEQRETNVEPDKTKDAEVSRPKHDYQNYQAGLKPT